MKNAHYRTCNMASKTEKMWKMSNAHYRTSNVAINLENVENAKVHFRTCNRARKLKRLKNDKGIEKRGK